MIGLISILGLIFVILLEVYRYKHRPMCHWCNVRHYGRCIWNPRSRGIFANTNDGHFDYEDPNK